MTVCTEGRRTNSLFHINKTFLNTKKMFSIAKAMIAKHFFNIMNGFSAFQVIGKASL